MIPITNSITNLQSLSNGKQEQQKTDTRFYRSHFVPNTSRPLTNSFEMLSKELLERLHARPNTSGAKTVHNQKLIAKILIGFQIPSTTQRNGFMFNKIKQAIFEEKLSPLLRMMCDETCDTEIALLTPFSISYTMRNACYHSEEKYGKEEDQFKWSYFNANSSSSSSNLDIFSVVGASSVASTVPLKFQGKLFLLALILKNVEVCEWMIRRLSHACLFNLIECGRFNPFIYAMNNGMYSIALQLLKIDNGIHFRELVGRNNWNAFHYATFAKQEEILQYLFVVMPELAPQAMYESFDKMPEDCISFYQTIKSEVDALFSHGLVSHFSQFNDPHYATAINDFFPSSSFSSSSSLMDKPSVPHLITSTFSSSSSSSISDPFSFKENEIIKFDYFDTITDKEYYIPPSKEQEDLVAYFFPSAPFSC